MELEKRFLWIVRSSHSRSQSSAYVCRISFLASPTDSRTRLDRHTVRRSCTWAGTRLRGGRRLRPSPVLFRLYVKERSQMLRRTFLASGPGVSLQARAHVVARAHAAVLTGRAADRCWRKQESFRVNAQWQRSTRPPQPLWFTVLTVGAVETGRTLAGVGAETRAAVQTHGRAQSWRGSRALARRGVNGSQEHTPTLTRLTGGPAPARRTRARVWRNTAAAVVAVKTADH